MIDTKTTILHQEQIAPQIFRLRLLSPRIAREARPGQFVHLRIREGTDPLLRRPFSIHRVNRERGEVQVLYQVVGQGTRLLSRKPVGERLDVLGPLGHRFEVSEEGGGVLLVAGGIGIAPLVFLCEDLLRGHAVTALIGARSRDGILCHDSLRSGGVTVHIATDDGSLGHRGLVTDLLNAQLEAGREAVYACGPVAMLRTVSALCRAHRISCQISLESRMACGLGACLGCAVKVRSSVPPGYEYKRVCKEGPVFDAEEVIFDENLLPGH
ncbi:MAG: dihydroorotate dehydrogenase electron transfer subunit [Candidatus Latescibacterota bacterium]|nr:MAG: dihydroorotate dehydrogenase electron transfer subunit [Candidatus Latescibacterota bacterium]